MMKLTESHILLSHLRFHACHGVLAQERSVGNDYDLSLRIGCDLSLPVRSDDVADTLNYAEVYEEVKQTMLGEPCALLEHLAGRIAERLMHRFPMIESVELRLLKLNPPMGADGEGAGVSMKFNK